MKEKRVIIYVTAVCDQCGWWYKTEKNVLEEEKEEQKKFLRRNVERRAHAHEVAKGHSVSLYQS